MQPSLKVASAFAPASFTAGATASGNIDTLESDFAAIAVVCSPANTTSNVPTVLKLSESDDTVVTNFADITGAVGGTSFTIATQATTLQYLTLFNVDTRNRKRYLKVTVSPQTTQIISAVAMLGRNAEAPIAAAKAGSGVANFVAI